MHFESKNVMNHNRKSNKSHKVLRKKNKSSTIKLKPLWSFKPTLDPDKSPAFIAYKSDEMVRDV